MKVYLFNRGASPNIGDQLINFVILKELSALGYQITNNRDFPQSGGLFSNLISHFDSYLSDGTYIFNSDLTVIGGGNLIMDTKNVGIRWAIHHFWLSTLNILAGKPYYYLSVGVNPLRTTLGRIIFKFALEYAAKISARDSFSKSLIEELTGREDILLMSDPVLKISEYYPKDNFQQSGQGWIGICPIQMFPKITQDAGLNQRYISLNRGLIRELLKMGKKVHLFINSPDVDKLIFSDLQKDISHENLKFTESFESLEHYLEVISGLQFLFSARMHAVICATSYKISSIGFGWQPKMYYFYRDNDLEGYIDIIDELNTKEVDELISQFIERIQIGNQFHSGPPKVNFELGSFINH